MHAVRRVRRGAVRRVRLPAAAPDPLYPLKLKVAVDLGLLEKIRHVGWGGLSSAESGRVGGWMTRLLRYQPLPLRLLPGRRRRRAAM